MWERILLYNSQEREIIQRTLHSTGQDWKIDIFSPSVLKGVTQECVLGLVFFKIFINDFDEGIKGSLLTKLTGIANTAEDTRRVQEDLDRKGQSAETNKVQPRKMQGPVHRQNDQRHRMDNSWLGSTISKRDLNVAMDHKLNWLWRCIFTCFSKTIASRFQFVLQLHYSISSTVPCPILGTTF